MFSKNQLIVAFEGEPAVFVFEGETPFNFVKRLDLNFPGFRPYMGHSEGEKGIDIIEAISTLGKIESIKKVGDYFLVGYNPGLTDKQLRLWKTASSPEVRREMINEFEKETPRRIQLLDKTFQLLDDFPKPRFLNISSLMVRDGYLWGSKYDPDVEEDYFTIYKLEIQEK